MSKCGPEKCEPNSNNTPPNPCFEASVQTKKYLCGFVLMAKIDHHQHLGNHPVRVPIRPLFVWCGDPDWYV
jgi:hypothetical protein